jgi:hypothetical protein
VDTAPDITVRIPTEGDVEEDLTDKYFAPPTGQCTYWPAIGGALVVCGARDPVGPGQWHTYASGQWLRVDAEIGPAEASDPYRASSRGRRANGRGLSGGR